MLKASSTVVSIVPPKQKAARPELRVLDPYISQISLWSSFPAQNDLVQFENVEVPVSPWIAKALHRFCNSEIAAGEVEDLVARSVAVTAKCRTDLVTDVRDSATVTDVYSLQAEMMLAAAVGTVVVSELQQKCNELIATGSNDEVRELNQLQHETRNAVQSLRNSLDEAEKERASLLASSLLPAVETRTDVSLDLPVRKPSKPEVPLAPRVRPPCSRTHTSTSREARGAAIHVEEVPKRRNRIRNYTFHAVAAALLIGASAFWFAQHGDPPIVGDASASLAATMLNRSGVTQVQDRSPYVILTVREGFWDTSSDSRRRSWINELSQLAQRHGYSGLVVLSSAGTPLAEWVSGRGIQFSGG